MKRMSALSIALSPGVTLTGMSHANSTETTGTGHATDDAFLWLEDIHGNEPKPG